MKKPLKAIRSFFALSGKKKKDVIGTVLLYFKVSCLVRCYPLKKYYHRYFAHDSDKPFDFSPFRDDLVLIRKVIKHMPGKHTCLKESIIVHLFFRKKGRAIPLFLGVSTENEFLAHAWYEQDGAQGYKQVNLNEGKDRGQKENMAKTRV